MKNTIKIIGPCSKYTDGEGWVTEIPIALLNNLGFYKTSNATVTIPIETYNKLLINQKTEK